MNPTYTVAIDLSKQQHTATILEQHTKKACETVTIPVNEQGFVAFERTLEAYSDNTSDFVIGCEATGHYGETLLRRLQDKGYTIVRLNPAQVVQFRRGLGRRAKTDALDADAMARQLSVTDWHAELVVQETAQSLQRMTRLRLDFIEERSRWINRLRGILNQTCPELEKLLKKMTSPTTLAILSTFPSKRALASASIEEIAGVARQASRGAKGSAFAEELKHTAQASVGLDDTWLEAELKVIVQQVIHLTESVKELEKNIADLTARLLEEYSTQLGLTTPLTLESFPIGSPVTIGTLISEMGDISRFPSLKHLLSYFGWCPQTQESGMHKVAHPRMSKRGNRFVRRILYMMAVAAVRWVPEYRDYFDRRVAAGKSKMNTIIAVGRKLLSVFLAILRTGVPYNPDRYLQQPQFAQVA